MEQTESDDPIKIKKENMTLTDLPEEILIMILKKLDLYSLETMYNTSRRMRYIVCIYGVIRKCNMSMNVMATVNTLKTYFFTDISYNLLELNLCGVPDLSKATLLSTLKILENLKKLDVSYTNMTVIDLLDMQPACPTLKDISINFVFGEPGLVTLDPNTLLQCQSIFEHFDNVHFVGSGNNLIYMKLAFYLLEKANLNVLKYTVGESDFFYTTTGNIESNKMPQFNHFAIYLLNWKECNKYHGCIQTLPVLSMIDFEKFEFIIIIMVTMNGRLVNASPIFHKFFKDNFDITAEYSTDYQVALLGNVLIMVWDRETTTFDEKFFSKLQDHFRMYFPYSCSYPCDTEVPTQFDWFFVIPGSPKLKEMEDEYARLNDGRMLASNLVLNYNTAFRQKRKFQLSLEFIAKIKRPVTLTYNCDYLRKLTFLSLNGAVHYRPEFFTVLFRSCVNLITLNVEAPTISPCASDISRSIALNHSLKNFRLVDKTIDLTKLFISFGRCPTLENIHIHEEGEPEFCDYNDFQSIFEKCNNLYSLYIESAMSDAARLKKLRVLNDAKLRFNKHHLNIVLHAKSINRKCRYNYDPFLRVFNLSPIKPF